jgi:hypothetical protein
MMIPNPIETEKIALKLDAFRSVAEANLEVLENNPLLKEQFNLNMQMVQGFLNELVVWEKCEDQINYDCALGSAKIVIEHVHDLINHILEEC